MAAEPLAVVTLVSVNIKCHSLTYTQNHRRMKELKEGATLDLMTTYS